MRVLGIDPGTVRTGWGVVERNGSKLVGIEAGVIGAREGEALERRLLAIHEGLTEVIARHHPTAVAVEDIFFAKHANAALKLGHARGVALLAAAKAGLDVHAYPPATVKRALVGRGAADKEQIARLVSTLLGMRDLPVDASDALAVAITHLHAAASPLATKPRSGGRG
jgi:crossover junction endodeoxyribonuclease RuvC